MQKELKFKTNPAWLLLDFIPGIITSISLFIGRDEYMKLFRKAKTVLNTFPNNYRFDIDHLFFIGGCFAAFLFLIYLPIRAISKILTQKAAMNGEQVALTFVDYRIIKIKNGNDGPRSAIKLTFAYNNELLTINDPWLPTYQTEKFFENNNPTDFSITGHMHNDTIYIDSNEIEYVINENHRG